MKKSRKIIFVILMIILIVFLFNSSTKATGILSDAKSFLEQGESQKNDTGLSSVATTNTKFEDLAGFFWGIGVGVALITTATMGIKFLMASTEERSDIKRAMVPYAIGIAVIFGALTIWKVLIQVFESGL